MLLNMRLRIECGLFSPVENMLSVLRPHQRHQVYTYNLCAYPKLVKNPYQLYPLLGSFFSKPPAYTSLIPPLTQLTLISCGPKQTIGPKRSCASFRVAFSIFRHRTHEIHRLVNGARGCAAGIFRTGFDTYETSACSSRASGASSNRVEKSSMTGDFSYKLPTE